MSEMTAEEIVTSISNKYGCDRQRIAKALRSYGYIVSDSEALTTNEGKNRLKADMSAQPSTSRNVMQQMPEKRKKYLQEFNAYCEHVNAMSKDEVIGALIEEMSVPGCIINEFFALDDFNHMGIGKMRSLLIMERAETPITVKRQHYAAIITDNQASRDEKAKEEKALEESLSCKVSNQERKNAGVLPLFYQACSDDFCDDCGKVQEYLNNLLARNYKTPEMMITSERGNGKTWAASMIVNEMLKHGRNKARIISIDDFSMKMNKFDFQNDYLRELRNLEFLAIDDFGAYSLTEKKQQALFATLKNRRANKLYTVFCVPENRSIKYSPELEHEVEQIRVRAKIEKGEKAQ